MEFDLMIVLQIGSYAAGIIGGGYGLYMRRKVGRAQLKAERNKASYYQAKRKAEDARRAQHTVEAGKTLWDWFTGNRAKPSDAI